MIERVLTRVLHQRLAQFTAVTLVGPRQCGKTTLARTLTRRCFNLEVPEECTQLDARWEEVVAGNGPVVFDEAPHWPELFRRLRGAIDERRKENGRFILLGSIAPSLMRDVGESLAGRMAVLELAAFGLNEVGRLERLWRCGGSLQGTTCWRNPGRARVGKGSSSNKFSRPVPPTAWVGTLTSSAATMAAKPTW